MITIQQIIKLYKVMDDLTLTVEQLKAAHDKYDKTVKRYMKQGVKKNKGYK